MGCAYITTHKRRIMPNTIVYVDVRFELEMTKSLEAALKEDELEVSFDITGGDLFINVHPSKDYVYVRTYNATLGGFAIRESSLGYTLGCALEELLGNSEVDVTTKNLILDGIWKFVEVVWVPQDRDMGSTNYGDFVGIVG